MPLAGHDRREGAGRQGGTEPGDLICQKNLHRRRSPLAGLAPGRVRSRGMPGMPGARFPAKPEDSGHVPAVLTTML